MEVNGIQVKKCFVSHNKMKLLFLVNKTLYNTKMSRVRFHGINALSKKTSVAIWGRGWKGYDNNLTVQQNLDKKDKYDAVIAYKPLELKDFKNIKPLKCLRYNEMYNVDWTLKEIRESGAQLVICHHMNNYEQYRKILEIVHYANILSSSTIVCLQFEKQKT